MCCRIEIFHLMCKSMSMNQCLTTWRFVCPVLDSYELMDVDWGINRTSGL